MTKTPKMSMGGAKDKAPSGKTTGSVGPKMKEPKAKPSAKNKMPYIAGKNKPLGKNTMPTGKMGSMKKVLR